MTITTRETDETVLAWIRARERGEATTAMARRMGIRSERIRTATNRVMHADRAESGECTDGHYWGRQ